MIPNRYSGITRLHLSLQIGGSLLLFWAMFGLLNLFFYKGAMESWTHYVVGSLLFVVSLLIEYSTRSHSEKNLSGLNRRRLGGVTHRQLVFSMATIFGFIVMSKDQTLSRVFLASFFMIEFAWIAWSNCYGFRILNRYLYRTKTSGKGRAVIVGSGSDINQFIASSSSPTFPGLDLFGYVKVGEGQVLPNQLPDLGNFQNIRGICDESKAKALVLLGMQNRKDLVSPVVKLADDFGLRAMWIDNVDSNFGQRFHPYHTGKYSIVSHINEPLEDPVNRLYKRAFDLFGTLVGVCFVLPPAMIAVWLIQRIKAPGPLFYRQERTGRNGEPFKVYKFRSMYVDRNDEGTQTRKNDCRIFPGGDFIRKSSIDELPQLINVLRGEMSLVGPRPHAEFTDVEHADSTHLYRLRSLAKPGITGLAQCKGFRGETTEPSQIRHRVRMDLFYIQKWSPALDVIIVLETLVQLVKPPKSAF